MIRKVLVSGVVQGVGFRPFAARLAEEMGIQGTVKNLGGVVELAIWAGEEAMDAYIRRLKEQPPLGAQVLGIWCQDLEGQVPLGFSIVESSMEGNRDGVLPMLPPDLPTCPDCLAELHDPGNRRYGYPFISCASCGPRYSIMEKLPYDRETTSMEDFPMCQPCQEEYQGRGRRRHAQTISCFGCGPQLLFRGRGQDKELAGGMALKEGVEKIKGGGILAVKGIGGYQLVCSPWVSDTVERLRLFKGREKKPFAVMVPDLAQARKACFLSQAEEELLASSARPILLLKKRSQFFAKEVDGDSRYLGLFLPYTPLHHMLMERCGPLVVTSANQSSQPIIWEDQRILSMDSPLLEGILYHKRRITTPLDDSLAWVFQGAMRMLRRSRGYVPLPVCLPIQSPQPFLAMGGDLKACFSLVAQDQAYLSQYFGDLENWEAFGLFQENIDRMKGLLGVEPLGVVCDLHPGYASSRLAEELAFKLGGSPVKIQHHHAHVGSVMAEHGLDGCIGVVFDGTGYGTDGTVWGGEFLVCKEGGFCRRGHLAQVDLCGGDALACDGSLAAMSYLAGAFGDQEGLLVPWKDRYPLVLSAIAHQVNTAPSSSMGRLFDGVSAMLGIRQANSYEGECAMALEGAAAASKEAGEEPCFLEIPIALGEDGWRGEVKPLVRSLWTLAHGQGAKAGPLAYGFHEAVARMVQGMCTRIREETGENRVGLSGGVFANQMLSGLCQKYLAESGFQVYFNSQVPCNDGGLSLGQAWLGTFLFRGKEHACWAGITDYESSPVGKGRMTDVRSDARQSGVNGRDKGPGGLSGKLGKG